ncbi:cobalamin biosynthesis protein CobG [Streptomyces sp. NBC_00083]|uniref:cobalamin biosynthesis protein CobG n=1 Tax=Streptomyces sp. NBC_00083 TaxID=2975647 RepID=UPI002251882A|nr:cobalamin biosynthesis protein CobG [Streptomyces sp. NBC_00083]MCX5388196.1 cobalamin biosynthesis protein CobG [Streptomyces sp. NBC_00083]
MPRGPVVRDRGDACPGALRLHTADDGNLARLRLPGGLLTDRQVHALATATERYADGHLTLTSRGNTELRGIAATHATALAELLRHTGLMPSESHERVRNIVASPLAGLDGRGHGGARTTARLRALDALLCAEEWTTALSGRFLFAVDDGRGDVASLGADVTLLAQERDTVVVRVGASALRVDGPDAPRAALEAARAFLESAAGTGAWRVRDLPPGHDVGLAPALARAGIPATTAPDPDPRQSAPAPPPPGIVASPDGSYALVVAPALGRVTAGQLRALPGPGGEVRITPWRGFVVPGFDGPGARARLRALDDAGFTTRPDAPWAGVGACTGRPGCAKALADVRRDALPGAGGLPVHWSGCERRCGHPHGDWVDVTATAEGRYTVTVRGDAPEEQQVPLDEGELAATVARARGGRPGAYGTGTGTTTR